MESSSRTVIVVAIIGFVGSLGAAIIGNSDKIFGHQPATPSQTPAISADLGVKTIVAPHAPTIEVNQTETTVWGEDTKLLSLAPGDKTTLDARDLYANIATYPSSGCAGPGYVIYTWQVRV